MFLSWQYGTNCVMLRAETILSDMKMILIEQKIYEIRGNKVMLDFDLAELYGTETRTLKQAVKRNNAKFPRRFFLC